MRIPVIRFLAAFAVVAVLVGAGIANGPHDEPAESGGVGDTLPLNDGGQFVFWNLTEANAATCSGR
jgi:hypothetical protein